MAYRKSILLDFDGVLHQYTGWNGGKLNEPLPGARKACLLLERDFRLICFTTRALKDDQREDVERWLKRWGFPSMLVTATKEPAILCIDDRALLFTGQWTDDFLSQVRNFRTYWEHKPSPQEPLPESAALLQSLADDQPLPLTSEETP